MKKNEQLRLIFISYLVTIIFSFVINILKSSNPIINGLISSIKLSTVLSVWWIFYFKYGWKIKHLNKILYRINLNGTWFGDYESSDLNGEKIYKGKIGLRINQSFLNISVESFTEKYSNFSYSEEVKYEEKSNRHGLIYVYSQKDNHDFQLNQRNGTSELVVSNYKNDILLEGLKTIQPLIILGLCSV